MIKLSLKFDMSLGKLVLVFVGSTACYGLAHYFSNSISSTHPQNVNDVLENHSIEVLPKVSQKMSSSEKRYADNETRAFKKSDFLQLQHENPSKATADVLKVDPDIINVNSKMQFNNNNILETNTCNIIEDEKIDIAEVSEIGNSYGSYGKVELTLSNGSFDEKSVGSNNSNRKEAVKKNRDSQKKDYLSSDVSENDKKFSVNLKKHYKLFDALRQFLSFKSYFLRNFLDKTDTQTLESKTSKKTITQSIQFLKGYYENKYSKIKPYDESEVYEKFTTALDEIIKELLDNMQKDVNKSKVNTAKLVINKKRKYFKYIQNICACLQSFLETALPLIKNPENIKEQTVEQLQNIIAKRLDKIEIVKKEVLNLIHRSYDGKMSKKFVSLFSNTENIVKLLKDDLMTKKF